MSVTTIPTAFTMQMFFGSGFSVVLLVTSAASERLF